MKRLMLFTLLFTSLSTYAQRQDTVLNKEVKVSTDYNPVIDESERIFLDPSSANNFDAGRTQVDYDLSVDPINSKLELESKTPQAIQAPSQDLGNMNYLRLGFGSYGSLFGTAYLSLLQMPKSQLNLLLKHRSIWGKVKLDNGYKSPVGLNNTYAKLGYETNYNDLLIGSKVFYNYDGYNYYGLNGNGTSPSELNQLQTDLGINIYIKSNLNNSSVVKHETNFDVDLFTLEDALTELTLSMNGSYVYQFGDVQNIGLDADVTSYSYNMKDVSILKKDDRVAVKLKPYYLLADENWQIKFGFGLYSCFASKNEFLITPNLEGRIGIAGSDVMLYSSLDGDMKINDFNSVANENKYISPLAEVSPTKIPINGTIGVRGMISRKLSTNLWARYTKLRNQYLFTNSDGLISYTNQFSVVYDDIDRSTVGGDVSYTETNFFDVLLSVNYNTYNSDTQQKAWYMPHFESSIGVNYYWQESWKFSIVDKIITGRYSGLLLNGDLEKLDTYNDLRLGAEYSYTKNVKFFAQLNNMLNQQNYAWKGYNALGINLEVGGSITF